MQAVNAAATPAAMIPVGRNTSSSAATAAGGVSGFSTTSSSSATSTSASDTRSANAGTPGNNAPGLVDSTRLGQAIALKLIMDVLFGDDKKKQDSDSTLMTLMMLSAGMGQNTVQGNTYNASGTANAGAQTLGSQLDIAG